MKEGTPLQRKLAKLAYILLGGALLLGVIVFAVHRFDITFEVLQYAVSTGIAIIPECLGVVLTITFVYATKEMKVNNVLVR
jgi:P-type Na+/K+ transporter